MEVVDTNKGIIDFKEEVFQDLLKGIVMKVPQPENKVTRTLLQHQILTLEGLTNEVVQIAEKKSKLTRSQREYLTIGFMMTNHEGQRLYDEHMKPKSVIVDEKGETI